MQQVKKTPDYTVYQKKSGRYAVKDRKKRLVHGDDKARILLAENLIAPPKVKAPAAPEPEAASTEESSAS